MAYQEYQLTTAREPPQSEAPLRQKLNAIAIFFQCDILIAY